MTEIFLRIPEEKQLRVLQAAIDEFAEYGYEHTNTNRIAKAADISVGSLFKYFDSKEDLFITTVKHGSTELKKQLLTLAEGE